MVTPAAHQARDVSPVALHPFIASTSDPWLRLVRAYYWSVVDMDFRHAEYWRQQVAECHRLAVAAVGRRSANEPDHIRARRDQIQRDQIGRAMIEGYAAASKKPYRGGVPVPGFESGSVCNTRTLSHGGDFRGSLGTSDAALRRLHALPLSEAISGFISVPEPVPAPGVGAVGVAFAFRVVPSTQPATKCHRAPPMMSACECKGETPKGQGCVARQRGTSAVESRGARGKAVTPSAFGVSA